MNNESLLDDVITTEGSQQIYSVGLGTRFAHLIIDSIAVVILAVLITFTSPFFFGASLSGYILSFAYYAVLEAATGQTLGKMITGSIVVDEFGEKIDGGKAVIRNLIRLIPIIDALSFFFIGDNRGLHDTLSKTYVIKKPSY